MSTPTTPQDQSACCEAGNVLDMNALRGHFLEVRDFTDRIVNPLSPEDCMVQSMDDASPTRWHMAHTTWFFETFVLNQQKGYQVFDEAYNYLFNSYYNSIGTQFPRPQRGFVSRPGLNEIKKYRSYVNEAILDLLDKENLDTTTAATLLVGLSHEQQHQELMLTDIKHVLSCNPMAPSYMEANFVSPEFGSTGNQLGPWLDVDEGVYEVGFDYGSAERHLASSFSFDNESPKHRVFLENFRISKTLVTSEQYIEFIESGGYQKPENWLSEGWAKVNESDWHCPMYWVKKDGQWMQFTLSGLLPVQGHWPVCHLSYFEADAFARWAGMRLPTEFEWEIAHHLLKAKSDEGSTTVNSDHRSSCGQDTENYSDERPLVFNQLFADPLFDANRTIHPTESFSESSQFGFMGSVWQWTSSSYAAYPGYSPPEGAIGEYNGKFMCNQYVLRGGSVATHSSHIRPTYRNFFPAQTRWQFSGLRLAESGL